MATLARRRGVTAKRRSAGFSPSSLSPLTWYDVHLAGAAGNTLADQMGGTAANLGSTGGSDTNDPLWLQRSSTDYLYLPATAGNTLTCTAPAGTANYRTTDSSGTQNTVAASPGAFTFSTGGSWASVELLNGSAVVIAKFTASLSAQGGHTDSFGVAWTINRATSGRKAALVKGRGVLLLGTDDYLTLPAGAMPAATATDSFSIMIVGRQFDTPVYYGEWIANKTSDATSLGFCLKNLDTQQIVYAQVGDGATNADAGGSGPAVSVGLAQVMVLTVAGQSATGMNLYRNGTQSTSSLATVGNRTTTAVINIGRISDATFFQDFEFIAAATWSRALTSTEVDSLMTYYGAGT